MGSLFERQGRLHHKLPVSHKAAIDSILRLKSAGSGACGIDVWVLKLFLRSFPAVALLTFTPVPVLCLSLQRQGDCPEQKSKGSAITHSCPEGGVVASYIVAS